MKCRILFWPVVAGIGAAAVTSALTARRPGRFPRSRAATRPSCQTCHLVYPKLTPFGEAFRRNGYRFPDNRRRVRSEGRAGGLGQRCPEGPLAEFGLPRRDPRRAAAVAGRSVSHRSSASTSSRIMRASGVTTSNRAPPRRTRTSSSSTSTTSRRPPARGGVLGNHSARSSPDLVTQARAGRGRTAVALALPASSPRSSNQDFRPLRARAARNLDPPKRASATSCGSRPCAHCSAPSRPSPTCKAFSCPACSADRAAGPRAWSRTLSGAKASMKDAYLRARANSAG